MKFKLLIALVPSIAGFSGTASAQSREITVSEQQVKALGPLPEDKLAEAVTKSERNPFAEKLAPSALAKLDVESEDAKLRRYLTRISIDGIIGDANGRISAMIGGKLYQEGDKLAPLLSAQTSLLRVSRITRKEVEFTWVETQPDTVPQRVIRKLSINEPIIKQKLLVISDDDGGMSDLVVPVTTNGEFLKLDPDVPAEDKEAETETKAPPREAPAPNRNGPGSYPTGPDGKPLAK